MVGDDTKEVPKGEFTDNSTSEKSNTQPQASAAEIQEEESTLESARDELRKTLKEKGDEYNLPELEGSDAVQAFMQVPEDIPMGPHLQGFIDSVSYGSAGARVTNLSYKSSQHPNFGPDGWEELTLELAGGKGNLGPGNLSEYGPEAYGFIDALEEKAVIVDFYPIEGEFLVSRRRIMKRPETDEEKDEWEREMSQDQRSTFAITQQLADLKKVIASAERLPLSY